MPSNTQVARNESTSQDSNGRTPSLIPAVDVYENEKELLLIADLPAVPQDGLAVEMDRGELRIEGKRADGRTYRRMFTVPDGIDADAVKADLTGGVLKVTLPKAPEVRPRRIEVTAA